MSHLRETTGSRRVSGPGSRRLSLAAALTGLIALVAAGCGSSGHSPSNVAGSSAPAGPQAAQPAEVAITARDFSYSGLPATLTAGWTTFAVTNQGPSPHHARLARLNPGATVDDLQAALRAQDRARFGSMTSPAGGLIDLSAGTVQRVTIDLQAGTYLLFSTASTADGPPDIARGMQATFTVTSDRAGANPPPANGDVVMKDFSFTIPPGFGRGTYHVINQGPSPHALELERLDQGKTLADVRQLDLNGPPPPWAHLAGGVAQLPPGGGVYLSPALTPGHYIAADFSENPATHQLDAALGMLSEFDIA